MDASPITPIPAPDESAPEALGEFYDYLQETADALLRDSSPSPSPIQRQIELNAVLLVLIPGICTAVGAALGAWLNSHGGRKVRIKVGDIEAEAHTREEVEKLLARAQEIQHEIQQRNQPPKVIP